MKTRTQTQDVVIISGFKSKIQTLMHMVDAHQIEAWNLIPMEHVQLWAERLILQFWFEFNVCE